MKSTTFLNRRFLVVPVDPPQQFVHALYFAIVHNGGNIISWDGDEVHEQDILIYCQTNFSTVPGPLHDLAKHFNWVIVFVQNWRAALLPQLYRCADDVLLMTLDTDLIAKLLEDSLKGCDNSSKPYTRSNSPAVFKNAKYF